MEELKMKELDSVDTERPSPLAEVTGIDNRAKKDIRKNTVQVHPRF